MGATEGLERILLAIAARCLRIPVQEIDPGAPLVRYGLDSLTALEIIEAVCAETGLDLTEDDLVDMPSIQDLALRLMVPAQFVPEAPNTVERMRCDAMLDADIGPHGLPTGAPGRCVLTGANGFLGVHLLHELVEAGAREVVCLVRAQDDEAAAGRLYEAMHRHRIAVPRNVIRIMAADIGAPRLGSSAEDYADLAHGAGVVVHCAAEVNWASSYEGLRAANVETTRALLRFACTGVAKRFHFVSSISAGYSSREPSILHESSPVADPGGLHLGYARAKWVAERLVEAARARGLEATVHRPSLIVGHSRSGLGNDEDLFARLLLGCIALGHAPDLDWQIDACPVDFVARALARVPASDRGMPATVHLRNPRPARWTEAVLWLNLRGYRVVLEPYAKWADRVRREALPGHPLHALRAFLLQRPAGELGLHLPELYAHPHVRRVCADVSDALIGATGTTCPPLDARLLERYLDRWVEAGLVSAPRHAASRRQTGDDDERAVEQVLVAHFSDRALRVASASGQTFGSDASLIGELGSWRAGGRYAMRSQRTQVVRSDGSRSTLHLVLKPKLPDDVVLDVTHEVATLCGPALGRAFEGYRERSEFAGARQRECDLYRHATTVLRDHMPLCFGVSAQDPPVIVLEQVQDVVLADAVDDIAAWTPECLAAALTGAARMHGQFLADERALALLPLRPLVPADARTLAWWSALGAHADASLQRWLGGRWRARLDGLLRTAPATRAWMAQQPATLVHGDFNPRNLVLRRTALGPKLCAFDWELAARGLPQSDIVELLCFVLDPCAASAEVRHHVECARLALQRGARRDIDPGWWYAGLRAAVADFGMTRLPMYFMAHRFRPQGFLERVARCWDELASVLGTEP